MKKYRKQLNSMGGDAIEEQESLVDVLQKRLVERRRAALVKSVSGARKEFSSGKIRPATAAKILRKIF